MSHNKHHKHHVKHYFWNNGEMEIAEFVFDALDLAETFIETITFGHVKIFNPNGEVILNEIRECMEHKHKHEHDYC